MQRDGLQVEALETAGLIRLLRVDTNAELLLSPADARWLLLLALPAAYDAIRED